MGLLKRALFIGGLGVYYAFVNPSSEQLSKKEEYPLPKEIKVVEPSLRFKERAISMPDAKAAAKGQPASGLEKIVNTDSIDFSKDFYIKTDRYTIVRDNDKDFLLSRFIGHIMSTFGKIL